MKRSRQVRRYKPVDYLPASELARFGRCEHLVEIERKHGQVVSEREKQLEGRVSQSTFDSTSR